MKKSAWLLAGMLACCSFGMAQAADMKADAKKTIAGELESNIKVIESELVPAVEAMPEDKFTFAPTSGEFKGARTFAQQAKHVAAVNYIVASAILEEKPPVDTGEEKGPDSITSKADIVKFLKDSFVYAHKAVASINEANSLAPIKSPFGKNSTSRLSMGTVFAWHGFDHYGQMVVYLRMNGIVPPASR
jgi:uncharacterized damage-inducible protein DinB